MDQLPFTVPSLEAVCFAHRHLLASAVFEDDVYPLYRTDDAHVAAQHYFSVEDVHVTGLEARKDTIEHFSCGSNAFRREGRDRAKNALVSAIILFAQRIDATVLAGGIETIDELATLIEIGVDLGQGFLLGRPSTGFIEPKPEIAAFFRSAPKRRDAN